jgi:hypothetical protein
MESDRAYSWARILFHPRHEIHMPLEYFPARATWTQGAQGFQPDRFVGRLQIRENVFLVLNATALVCPFFHIIS